MTKENIGRIQLIKTIGRDFCWEHKDHAVFSYGEEEDGLFCFLGIDLHPEQNTPCLSGQMSDWDIYASCTVKDDNSIVMGECRLPETVACSL